MGLCHCSYEKFSYEKLVLNNFVNGIKFKINNSCFFRDMNKTEYVLKMYVSLDNIGEIKV